jgi:hypothetical protein
VASGARHRFGFPRSGSGTLLKFCRLRVRRSRPRNQEEHLLDLLPKIVVVGSHPRQVPASACEIVLASVANVSLAISCLEVFLTTEGVCFGQTRLVVNQPHRKPVPRRGNIARIMQPHPLPQITSATGVEESIFGRVKHLDVDHEAISQAKGNVAPRIARSKPRIGRQTI